MQHRHVQVTWLRRGDCADDETCPAISDIGDSEALYFVADDTPGGSFDFPGRLVPEISDGRDTVRFAGLPCSDPDVVDAHSARIADHEVLYRVLRRDIPGPLLEAVTTR